MAHKKIVLVIVEGPSDDTALGVILNRLYDKNTVHIEIMHGDITADFSIDPSDAAATIGEIIKKYARSNHFGQKHFQEVIHLIDMDGVYIPDSSVIENADAEKPIYSQKTIETSKRELLLQRNLHKKQMINRLSTLNKVWGSIKYQAYYMSSNLDHVLYGKINSSDEDKENDAYQFAKQYKNDIDGFLTFISDSNFSRMDGYKESWKFIKQDFHSLERFTNLGLCFEKIREERKNNKK